MSLSLRNPVVFVVAFMLSLQPELALSAGSDGEVMRAADGTWNGPVKTQHFCDQKNRCRDLVVDLQSHRLLSVDGKLVGAFRETGKGKEIVRDSTAGIPAKIVNGKVVPANTP